MPPNEKLTHNEVDAAFWYELIDEVEAGRFLGLKARTMQAHRYHGTGPRYVKLSARSIKYRRADLRDYAETRLHDHDQQDSTA